MFTSVRSGSCVSSPINPTSCDGRTGADCTRARFLTGDVIAYSADTVFLKHFMHCGEDCCMMLLQTALQTKAAYAYFFVLISAAFKFQPLIHDDFTPIHVLHPLTHLHCHSPIVRLRPLPKVRSILSSTSKAMHGTSQPRCFLASQDQISSTNHSVFPQGKTINHSWLGMVTIPPIKMVNFHFLWIWVRIIFREYLWNIYGWLGDG